MLILRGLVGGLFQVAILAALLLIPAGTWRWPRALAFLAGYAVVLSISIVVLAIRSPGSLEARLEPPVARSQPRADRIATALLLVAIFGVYVLIPIDVFHLRLLPRPPLWVEVGGIVVFLVGFGITLSALLENAFATPVVRDQSEREQVLIDTGLYARVRHPFYTGLILFFLGIALWLESLAGALAMALVVAALVLRIRVEESTLRESLPGYSEYVERVPDRLIPSVW